MRSLSLAILVILSCVGCENSTSTKTDGDNTTINRDASGTKGAFDQNENRADIDTTAEIRKRIVSEKMSTNAKNITIVTQNGKVTLNGSVSSADEKSRIEGIARAVAGETNVDSQLQLESNR